ncbi:hypothetical protein IH992_24475 [Candidatus Poribacteria bacterium]|nr:hypothetical protein [Candidatus Poribacteria bacterium]
MIKLSCSTGIHALAITLMLGCFAISGAMADINDGLVAWWNFEGGSTNDAAGNNDGTAMGSPTVGEGYGGSDGLWFNGVDQYVTVPSSASLEISGDLSVVAWINVTVGNDHGGICWKGQGIGWGPRFSWRIATTTDTNITWGRTDGNEAFEGAELWFATDNVIPGLDQWVHVALTSSSTDGQRAYVNGDDVTSMETMLLILPDKLIMRLPQARLEHSRPIQLKSVPADVLAALTEMMPSSTVVLMRSVSIIAH